jgi:hypothetical protein
MEQTHPGVPMTDLKTAIEVGRKLAEKATARPWHTTDISGITYVSDENFLMAQMLRSMKVKETAAYIVHACNSWPLLAAEIERLEKENEQYKRGFDYLYGKADMTTRLAALLEGGNLKAQIDLEAIKRGFR